MSQTKQPRFIILLFVLVACTSPKPNLLIGKKWAGVRVDSSKLASDSKIRGIENFNTYVLEYKPDSFGVFERMETRIDWNDNSTLERIRDTFTYYRKGNSLFVKVMNDNRFQEQYIRELTDSTLSVEIAEVEGLVFHYKTLKQLLQRTL